MAKTSETSRLLRPDTERTHRTTRRQKLLIATILTVTIGTVGALVYHSYHRPTLNPKATTTDFSEFYATTESFLNKSVDPCDDFYEYACGSWIATHELPATSSSISPTFTVAMEASQQVVQRILESRSTDLGRWYARCLATKDNVNDKGLTVVRGLLEDVAQCQSAVDMLALAGKFRANYGIPSFLDLKVQAGPSDPTTNALLLFQGGMLLPARELYTPATETIYHQYVADVVGLDSSPLVSMSTVDANKVVEFEFALANISLPRSQLLSNPASRNNPYTFDQIKTEFPYVAAFLEGMENDHLDQFLAVKNHTVVIATPAFFTQQATLLDSTNLTVLQAYMAFHVLDTFVETLGESFRRVSFPFHALAMGDAALPPHKDFCAAQVATYLRSQISQAYIDVAFKPELEVTAHELIEEIEGAMHATLEQATWLDNATRSEALEKLALVSNMVGGPKQITPIIETGDGFFHDVLAVKQAQAKELLDRIGQPAEGDVWIMPASVADAFYLPSANRMFFPAGIFQQPFFFSKDTAPRAVNYARLGSIMGHELSHGFDNMGHGYDGHGAIRSWWTPSVTAEYEKRAQCLRDQYSAYPVTSDVHEGVGFGNLDGFLTLTENFADNSGLAMALGAFEHHRMTANRPAREDDLRLFFTAYAQVWCEKRSDDFALSGLVTDSHSPGRWRVNGVMRNSDAFAKAFQCPIGKPMHPKDKCKIWN